MREGSWALSLAEGRTETDRKGYRKKKTQSIVKDKETERELKKKQKTVRGRE